MAYRTCEDRLRDRRRVQETYTFRGIASYDSSSHVISPRRRQTQAVPVLTIHTDVSTMISQLEKTVVLRQPRLDPLEMNQELQASAARLLHVQSGQTLSKATQAPAVVYPIQRVSHVAFMDEREAIRPPRTYVVPQVPRPADFVFPDAVVAGDPSAQRENELNKFSDRIYEEDRERFNATIMDLNRRNRRRPYALGQQFEDFVHFGMDEARRRAQRSGRLSEMKELREEEWWSGFVGEFTKDGRATMDLVLLEMFTKVKEFNEEAIARIYKEALVKYRAGKRCRGMLTRANELAGVLEPHRLGRLFDDVDRRVCADKLMSGAG
jgi:hypothetical protein